VGEFIPLTRVGSGLRAKGKERSGKRRTAESEREREREGGREGERKRGRTGESESIDRYFAEVRSDF
jgi:hypothetical protein